MLEELREKVCETNRKIYEKNLSILTWGNVSGFSKEQNLVVIKPSGIEYSQLTADKMVIVDLDGNIISKNYKPSSDLLTHLEIYKSFNDIGSVIHTHSLWATSWAQANRSIPCLGTTHADYSLHEIPCTRKLNRDEINNDYELNTGRVIVETIKSGYDYHSVSMILCANHGPFVWGVNCDKALENAEVLEEIAHMAYNALEINEKVRPLSNSMIVKHFYRKNGKYAYYGQK